MITVQPIRLRILFRMTAILCLLASCGVYGSHAQNSTLEIQDTATLQQQMDHLQQRMNIYNGYRAVRDDIFLKMIQNSLDSLNAAKSEISQLESTLATVRAEMASLNKTLQQATADRDLAIRNKNSLSFFGIQMNKAVYNSILWTIILALLGLLVFLFLMFKRSYSVTRQTAKDLEETKEEFENYRQQSRERYEKLVVQHHKELMKIKGKRPGIRE